jgi:alpha-1,3/alpha-1,6-mannosyltransferase
MAGNDGRVVFFHPDLGIGGAERLVIDAAVGLQELGYKVTIFTSHCDPNHCFDEARDGKLNKRINEIQTDLGGSRYPRCTSER